nr:hypothetical protein [Tanacetum cinerariifolium]
MVIQNQSELGAGSAMPTDPHHTLIILQPSSSQPQKIQKPKKPKRKDTQVPQPSGPTYNVADKAVHKELVDSLVRAATTASSLEAEVLDLEKTKTSQRNEIDSLKTRVKKLKKRTRARTHKLKRLYKEKRIDGIDADDEITLVNDADNEMFDVDDLYGEEVFVAEQEIAKGIAFHEPGKSTTTKPTISSQQSHDKGKGIMIKEPVKPKKKDQIRLDEEAILKLQARVNTFEDIRTVLVKEKEKRAGDELIQESIKKQKVEDDKEKAELKQLMETISDEEEVAIDAISLAIKIKSLLDAIGIIAAQVCVNAAQLELVLLVNFNEKYTKCLLLLLEVKIASTKLMLLRKLILLVKIF